MPLSETGVQSRVVLRAPSFGFTLFRNNVGALIDRRGVPVRYGLCNESKEVNEKWKSGDLIGWRSVVVTPEMVGQTLAVFTSRECKEEGWQFTGDDHELAQARWAQRVNEAGGDACFVSSPDGFINPAFERRLRGA